MTKAEAKAAMTMHHRQGISLKTAWARIRGGQGSHGGGRKTTTTAKRSGTSSTGPARVGRIYQGASTGLGVMAPVTDAVLYAVEQGRLPKMNDFGGMAGKIVSVPYAENLAVEAATVAVDKRFGQAAALSRGSVTALAPEAYLAVVTAKQARAGNAQLAHADWSLTRNGYDPRAGAWYIQDTFKVYRIVKHGGQVLRKLRTRSAARGGIISRLLEPVGANILRPIGLTW